MISPKILAKTVEKFTTDNSPAILTVVGAAGALASVFLTAKASFKAADVITEEHVRRYQMDPDWGQDGKEDIPLKDLVQLTWKEFIPAAGVCTVTVASIICANRISTRRLAGMAAAYSLTERAHAEYKDKIVQKFTANKQREVEDEIAQDHVTKNPPREDRIIITGNGDVLVHDIPTGRYFRSNMEALRKMVNDINQQVNELGQATLSDFYVALGLSDTPYSTEIGWTSNKLLDVHYSTALTDDSQPCITINYHCEPLRSGFPKGCDDDTRF